MKKIFSILLCTLLIVNMIPAVESFKNNTIFSVNSNVLQTSRIENWGETQKILASDGAANDQFAYSVSLSNNTAIIGAFYDDDLGIDSGSAYVFTRVGSTWTLQQKLTASDGSAYDAFGLSVSVDRDTVLIGAYNADDSNGSAYVFTRTGNTWTQQAKLKASDIEYGDLFGWSVSLDGDNALIGTNQQEFDKGAAYVFTRIGTTWTQQAKLTASDGTTGDSFGRTVSLKGDTALIGAPGDDTWKGSTYVFTRTGTTWTQQQKLTASDGTAMDAFGGKVNLEDDIAIIGTPGDDDNGAESGSAYVFTRSGTSWTQQQKLTASDGTAGDKFGDAVSIDGDTIMIGADEDNNWRGAVYVFTHINTTWNQHQKLLASDGGSYERFGFSISINKNTAIIGAPEYGNKRGKAYVFEIINEPPIEPIINGPAKGKIKVETDYNFTATDPDNDEVYYFIDWGDGTNSSWIGSYPSGNTVTKSHTWSKKGDYTIKAKAKDSHGNESGWGILTVTMPTSYQIPFMQFWLRLFERFPHAFPLLRHLLGY